MRAFLSLCGFAALALGLVFLASASAQEKGEVTLKGKITCAKCELKKTDDCLTVIVTKKDGKDVITVFSVKSHDEHHDGICGSPKNGSIVGVMKKEKGKDVIDVKSLTFDQ